MVEIETVSFFVTINQKWICRKRNGKNEFYDGGYIEKYYHSNQDKFNSKK